MVAGSGKRLTDANLKVYTVGMATATSNKRNQMKLLKTIHHPDGTAGVVTDKILCVWEYKLPSGKTGTCGATATWELIYKTGMRQPFGAAGNVMLHTYQCDRHYTEETA